MLVYRDRSEVLRPAELLPRWRGSLASLDGVGAHDAATGLLIEFGMLEAGVVDTLCPVRDENQPGVDSLRAASCAAGALFCHTAQGALAELPAVLHSLEEALAALDRPGLPSVVEAKVPEGYAFYGLYPESYLAAAGRLADERGLAPGTPVLVLGLRSIGTSLSAVVAAALAQRGLAVSSATLRPRGHPFARELVLAPALEGWLAAQAGSLALVVDEGPGISGSSMAAVADRLLALGFEADQVVLMPGHRPDAERLRSERARAAWRRHPVAHVAFEATAVPGLQGFRAGRDLSAGAWRDLLVDRRHWPAVQPQHERRKYLHRGVDGSPMLAKFVGLGRFGECSRARAEALAEVGLGPGPIGLAAGFLTLPFLIGKPLRRLEVSPELASLTLAHLAFRARRCRTGAAASREPLLEMMRVNLRSALPPAADALLGELERAAQGWGAIEAVAPDNRLMPHEWLQQNGALVKVDTLDHDRDHFYPGTVDIAWDVAGFAVEFGLPSPHAAELAGRLGAMIGDPALPARLRFFEAAYASFRFGYATMAEETLRGSDEAARWRGGRQRYAARLDALGAGR